MGAENEGPVVDGKIGAAGMDGELPGRVNRADGTAFEESHKIEATGRFDSACRPPPAGARRASSRSARLSRVAEATASW